MKHVNLRDVPEGAWSSAKGKFAGFGKSVSIALGRPEQPGRLDHPFDLEILRIAPGQTPYPYHLHSAQWELYHVLSGLGHVRHADGTTDIETGDAFLFGPNEPHQLINSGEVNLVLMVIADNPVNESGYYPDSRKWLVRSPERRIMRGESLDYFDGEE